MYLYNGVAIHKICRLHGLLNGMTPEPVPEPVWEDGVCTMCQTNDEKDRILGGIDKVQKVASPEAFDGLREINSGIKTGITFKE